MSSDLHCEDDAGGTIDVESVRMLGCRRPRLIAALCGSAGVLFGTAASAFQYPPLSDDIHTRPIHRPEEWVSGGLHSPGAINQSPAEFGPAPGLWQRAWDGNPASGDQFPLMTPGPLPGGLSPFGFNSSGMQPPVNQPLATMNNPVFGGGQMSNSPSGVDPRQQNANGPFDPNQFDPRFSPGANPGGPVGATWGNPMGLPPGSVSPAIGAKRLQPKMSWTANSRQEPFVGLLGQFARPGTYEIPPHGTTLADLIQAIGGLAKDASGQFRVIRNGQAGQMVTASAAGRYELIPGDLIIAESTQGVTGTASTHERRDRQTSFRDASRQAASSDARQVALLNLIERPVVLKLRNEHATVLELLALLRQDSSLASRIKIVTPSSHRFQGTPRSDATLPDSTVLIFPTSGIDKDRIKDLPEPYRLRRESDRESAVPVREAAPPGSDRGRPPREGTIPQPSPPSMGFWEGSAPLPREATTMEQSKDSAAHVVVDVPPPPSTTPQPSISEAGVRGVPSWSSTSQARTSRDSALRHAPPADEPTNPNAFQTKTVPPPESVVGEPSPPPSSPAPSSTMKPREPSLESNAPLLDSLDSPDREPSRLKPSEPRRTRSIVDADSLFDEEFGDAAPLPPGSAKDSADEAASTASKANSPWSIWPPLLAASIGVLALFGFSLSLRRRTQAEAQASRQPSVPTSLTNPSSPPPVRESTVREPKDRLEEIISGQLQVTRESVPLASQMQFYGRPQPPNVIRLDQGHALPKPHGQESSKATRGTAAMSASSMTAPAPRSNMPPASAKRVDPPEAMAAQITSRSESEPATPTAAAAARREAPLGALDRALSARQRREEPHS